MSRSHLRLLALAPVLLTCAAIGHAQTPAAPKKPRVIATTDGEIDDRCSMIRFLMYANEWDIEGIILSSSKYHWKGDAKHKPHNWADESWLDRQLDAYAKVYANLKANDPAYPTPEFLRKQVFVGNVGYVSDMEQPSPGSSRIAEVLLDADPSPVWLLAWGGSNTIARALKTIEEEHPERVAEVSRKAKLFLISVQDDTLSTYLLKRWPKTTLILSTAFGAIAYRWQKIMSPAQQRYFDAKWMRSNILTRHGPLCAMYEAHRDGRFRSEGDSPSFMHLIDVGLGSAEDPTYGGWGGRFEFRRGYWRSALDDGGRYTTILRWAAAFQNDWAARADWCMKPPAQCNHPPRAVYNSDATKRVLRTKADPGREVRLSAANSSDPDGDRLRYRWWVYADAGSYWAAPAIRGADKPDAALVVPPDASGRTIHVILEVTDDGQPPLTAYRRVVVKVSGKPKPTPEEAYLQTPITRLSGPPAEAGRWTFYRGVNLNGPPIVIDGHRWDGDDAADFTCDNRRLHCPQVKLRPATDPARAAMIHSFRWHTQARLAMTGLPSAACAVYLYVWEDNNPETLTFSVNGKAVLRNHKSGVAGEWHRLGPWFVEARNGSIEVTSAGGAANISGIEVWKKAQ